VAFHPLRIVKIVRETADASSFVLEVPPELAETFGYRAGQFLTFELHVGGERLLRCYSLASSPDVDPAHKVTVKRVAEGRASNWFNDVPREGDVLEVMPPGGVFVLRPHATPLCLFAGGSGITPVISLVKSALATTGRRMKLVYANRDRDSIIFRDELERLVGEHPDRLAVVHHLDHEQGFLVPAQAKAHVAGLESADFYICGPGPFMDVVEATLLGVGVPQERIAIERFVSIGGPEDLVEDARAAREAAERAHPDEIVVRLDGRVHRVPYAPGDTVLAAARKGGLEPPFACEDGYCGSCAAKRLRGEVTMRKNEVFSQREVEAGNILTCQARPCSGELEVSYDE
jgi:3-ketosteroid 9alpha-monooxygenase subunit B